MHGDEFRYGNMTVEKIVDLIPKQVCDLHIDIKRLIHSDGDARITGVRLTGVTGIEVA